MLLFDEILGYISSSCTAECNVISAGGLIFIECRFSLNGEDRGLCILPVEITACSPQKAAEEQACRQTAVEKIRESTGFPVCIVAEDRWRQRKDLYKARLSAHLGSHESIFARNCTCRQINRTETDNFMDSFHTYGAASSRYRYGLFDRDGRLAAAATFSNARRWRKGEKTIMSYEWIRYASLPGVRIIGGMGKILKHFISALSPDDIMSYADLEWSDGGVYRGLGFKEDGLKSPVTFAIDPATWLRIPVSRLTGSDTPHLYLQNSGSIKYRLKLTEY